ncbi:hypothetical protein BD779DRAFT_1561102 [Infundibulicybe gibba]|nr:hypothetical protein BD779DRAFT_1561102 [Infundibulicybe gibba]
MLTRNNSVASIFSMPSELIETILILTALGDFPAAIASLAMTCRYFHRLVYHYNDHHLWREIYLTTFDDPRLSLGAIIPRRSTKDEEFDWAGEFTGRIAAAKFFKNCVENATDLSPENSERVAEALKYIHSTISTAFPVPPSSHVFDPIPPGVVFPRLTGPNAFSSLNTKWAQTLLEGGYPLALSKDILAPRTRPSQYGRTTHNTTIPTTPWEHTPAGNLFYKLVLLKSFIPNDKLTAQEKVSLSSNEQTIRARRLARKRVYDLRFLLPERCWGPFMPSYPDPSSSGDNPETPTDRIPPTQPPSPELYNGSDEYEADEFEFDEDEEDEILEFVHSVFTFPRPDKWCLITLLHLLNGQDEDLHLDTAQGPPLWKERWEFGSPYPVGQDVGSGTIVPPSSTSGTDDIKGKRKEGSGTSSAVAGWDWAGVAGEWRRCICWMDYHDLLYIPDEYLEETIRIFPMNLRVSGYSNPVLPDDVKLDSLSGPELLTWKLPIIHVEGTSRGSDLDTDVLRKIEGTVRMIGDNAFDGTTSHADSNVPQWVTEGIQIGSIGSAAGMIGMWTGAEHERTDPLGPFWAWRIG